MDWLGDVPEHWEVKKLKFLAHFCGGGTPSKAVEAFWQGDIPWVSPKDMKADVINDAEDHITEAAIQQSSTKLVSAGAVLIVVRSGILRHSIPVAINARDVALNQDMKAILPVRQLTASYLVNFIRGNQAFLLFQWRNQGATVESIEHELMANTEIPVPPTSEQHAIADYLRGETRGFDIAIKKAIEAIQIIREYRTRLIADVVTGKLDVRGVAVPEVGDEETSTDRDLSEGDESIFEEEALADASR